MIQIAHQNYRTDCGIGIQAVGPCESIQNRKQNSMQAFRDHTSTSQRRWISSTMDPNPTQLYGLLQKQTRESFAATSESFCVCGMEGNPVFPERLTKL